MSRRWNRIYRCDVIVTPAQGRTPDDVLAEAIVGSNWSSYASSVEGTWSRHGDLVAVHLRFLAGDDHAAAWVAQRAAEAVSGVNAAEVSSLRTGTGRSHRRLRPLSAVEVARGR